MLFEQWPASLCFLMFIVQLSKPQIIAKPAVSHKFGYGTHANIHHACSTSSYALG
jgi:hypothetical protein